MQKIGKAQSNYILKRTEILIYIANGEEWKGFKSKLDSLDIKTDLQLKISNNYILYPIKYGNYHICYYLGTDIGGRELNDSLFNIGNKFKNLQYIVNIGCCGSLKTEDKKTVIFANRIFDIDKRKEAQDGTLFSIGENKHTSFANSVKSYLDTDISLEYLVKYDPLVSGSAVIKSGDEKDKIIKAYPCAAGVEMEGLAASSYAIARGIEWIVIKGCSDNCVDKNGHAGQLEATFNSADLFFKLLSNNILKLERVKIFVSGSTPDNLDAERAMEVENNCALLGDELLQKNYKIINGLGYGIGTALVSSVYSYRRNCNDEDINKCIEIFPFPRRIDNDKSKVRCYYIENRNRMIDVSTFSLFLYGKKKYPISGTEEEFDFAQSQYLPRIVIPFEGYISENLYDKLLECNFDGIKSNAYVTTLKKIKKQVDFKKRIKNVLKALSIIDDFYFGINTH